MPREFRDARWSTWRKATDNRHALAEARSFLRAGDGGPDLFLCGPVGTGKTRLACTVLNEAWKSGERSMAFERVPILLYRLQPHGAAADTTETFDRLAAAKLLVLDDLGRRAGRGDGLHAADAADALRGAARRRAADGVDVEQDAERDRRVHGGRPALEPHRGPLPRGRARRAGLAAGGPRGAAGGRARAGCGGGRGAGHGAGEMTGRRPERAPGRDGLGDGAAGVRGAGRAPRPERAPLLPGVSSRRLRRRRVRRVRRRRPPGARRVDWGMAVGVSRPLSGRAFWHRSSVEWFSELFSAPRSWRRSCFATGTARAAASSHGRPAIGAIRPASACCRSANDAGSDVYCSVNPTARGSSRSASEVRRLQVDLDTDGNERIRKLMTDAKSGAGPDARGGGPLVGGPVAGVVACGSGGLDASRGGGSQPAFSPRRTGETPRWSMSPG